MLAVMQQDFQFNPLLILRERKSERCFMDRFTLVFNIEYSIRLEGMIACLMGRVDRLITFLLLLSGVSVATDLSKSPYAGWTIAALTMFSFVYMPSARAANAKGQKKKYEGLLAKSETIGLDDLRTEYVRIQADDSDVLGGLCNVAHIGVEIARGQRPTVKLSIREIFLAWLAGDLPKSPNHQ